MKKSDLKNGMIVTLRKGVTRVIVGNCLVGEQGDITSALDYYNDDLTHVIHAINDTSDDIVKIEYGGEIIWERKTDWSKVPFGAKVIAWGYNNKNKQVGRFLCYDKNDEGDEFPFLVFIESEKNAYWYKCCEIIEEVIQLARKKKEAELSPEEERRLEITKKLNKEQKLFCYHFIVEDKSMKDAYKAAYP